MSPEEVQKHFVRGPQQKTMTSYDVKLRHNWQMAAILNSPSWISGFPKLQENTEIERKLIKTNKEKLM